MPAELSEWLVSVGEAVGLCLRNRLHRAQLLSDLQLYAEDAETRSNAIAHFHAERDTYALRVAGRPVSGALRQQTRKRPRPGWRFERLAVRDAVGCNSVEAWVPPRLCHVPPEYVCPLPLVDGRVLSSVERTAVLCAIRDVVYKGVPPIEPWSDAGVPSPDSEQWSADVARVMHHYSFRALREQVRGLKNADRPSIEEMLRLLRERFEDPGAQMPPLLRLLKTMNERESWLPKELPPEVSLDARRALDNEGWVEVQVARAGGWFSPLRDRWAGGDMEHLSRKAYPIRVTAAGKGALAAWEINHTARETPAQVQASVSSAGLVPAQPAIPALKPKQVSALKLIRSKPTSEAAILRDQIDEGVFRSLDHLELIEVGAHLYEGVHWFSPQRSNGFIFGGRGTDDWDFVLDVTRHDPEGPPLVRISSRGKGVLAHIELEDAPSVGATAASPGKPPFDVHPATIAKAILFEQPDITPTDLARRLGVSPSTLYSKRKGWKDVRAILLARPKHDAAAGIKTGGDLEAWSADDHAADDE